VEHAAQGARRRARLAKPITPHSLRHYAGSRTMPSDGRFESGVGPKLHLETGNTTRDRSA
jgi:integrase